MKPLVNLNLLHQKDEVMQEAKKALALVAPLNFSSDFVMANDLDISDIITHVINGKDVHFVTNGKWSLHDLVSEIVKLYAPLKLTFCTFSITEFPGRLLAQWIAEGTIEEMNVLLDVRAKANYPNVLQLIQNIASSFKLVPVHAKSTVLVHNDISITIIGSANWTQNPRYEIGYITSNKEYAFFQESWIKNVIADGKK